MKSLLALIPTAGLLISSIAVAGPWGPAGTGQSPAAAGLAGAGYLSGSSPGAGPLAHGDVPHSRFPSTSELKARALHNLRDEGLKLQKADGGKLTPEHYAYLQTRLDAINAKYR